MDMLVVSESYVILKSDGPLRWCEYERGKAMAKS